MTTVCVIACTVLGILFIMFLSLVMLNSVVNQMTRHNRPLRVLCDYLIDREQFRRWQKEQRAKGTAHLPD